MSDDRPTHVAAAKPAAPLGERAPLGSAWSAEDSVEIGDQTSEQALGDHKDD